MKKINLYAIGFDAVKEPKRTIKLKTQMQITELDISVYPKEHNARERKPEDFNTDFTAEKEQQQLEAYKMCFELFRNISNTSGVLLSGTSATGTAGSITSPYGEEKITHYCLIKT